MNPIRISYGMSFAGLLPPGFHMIEGFKKVMKSGSLLLMVQKSQTTTWDAQNVVNKWGFHLPTSTG